MDDIFVNLKNTSIRLSLPSGAGYDLPPNHAIKGAHYRRVAAVGLLRPLAACPGFKPIRIHEPEVSPHSRMMAAAAAPVAPAPAATKSTATKAAAVGGSGAVVEKPPVAPPKAEEVAAVTEELKVVAGDATAPQAPDECQGKTAEEWWRWISDSADSTIVQTLKLAELQAVAAFLGVPGVGMTKLDTISALRAAIEGRNG